MGIIKVHKSYINDLRTFNASVKHKKCMFSLYTHDNAASYVSFPTSTGIICIHIASKNMGSNNVYTCKKWELKGAFESFPGSFEQKKFISRLYLDNYRMHSFSIL